MCILSNSTKPTIPLVMLRSIAVFPKIHPYHYMQNSGKIHEYRPANFVFLIPSEKNVFVKPTSLVLKHFKSFVLRRFHNLPLSRSFIVYSAEMENTVNNNPQQFLFVSFPELLCICAYCIE